MDRKYLRTFVSPCRGNEVATLHQESHHEGGRLLLLVKDGQPARIDGVPHRGKTHRSYVVVEQFEVNGIVHIVTETGERFKLARSLRRG